MAYLKSLLQNVKPLDVYKNFPDTALPLIEYQDRLLRSPSPFTMGERELMMAFVSALNTSHFCQGLHGAIAAQFGLADDLLLALVNDIDTAPVAAEIKPIMKYIRKLTLSPAAITFEDAEAIYAAGWDEKALYDAASVCALSNFMNRLVAGLGLTADTDYFHAAAEGLAAHGYAPLAELVTADKEPC